MNDNNLNIIKDEILYIDDLEANLEIFKMAFRKYYHIHLANSAKEGFEILSNSKIKVLISDQRMPEMTGVEFLVRTAEIYPDLPRIILTAYADVDDIIEAVNKGNVYRYMLKPWNVEDLKLTIDKAIETYKLKHQNKILINDLLELNKQLEEINISLEYKVIERTKKIEEQNKEILFQSENLKVVNEELLAATEELAIKNEQLSVSYDNLKLLSEIGKKIISSLDLKTIIESVYDHVTNILDIDVFSIGIYDKNTNSLIFPISKENNKIIPFFNLQKDENYLANICFNTQEHILINNFSTEFTKYFSNKSQRKTNEIMESIIYIPIISKEKSIGTITIQTHKPNAYNEFHLNLLKNIAIYTSIALENSDTYTHIENQKRIIEAKNENINAGLRYAKNIQNAILPEISRIEKYFESFMFYLPLEIVSGDFYWFNKIEDDKTDKFYISVIDCTGHGVSGAFMSLIGNRLLEEIVNIKKFTAPAEILTALDKHVKRALNYEQTDITDGMDMCFCYFELKENGIYDVTFAGAKRPLYIYKDAKKELIVLKGDRKSIGGEQTNSASLAFTNQKFEFHKNDVIYLTTDGYIDQNDRYRKKIGSPGLINLIKSCGDLDIYKQKLIFMEHFFNHKSEEHQRDDVTILALKNSKYIK